MNDNTPDSCNDGKCKQIRQGMTREHNHMDDLAKSTEHFAINKDAKTKGWTINPEIAIKNMKAIVLLFIIAAGSVVYVIQTVLVRHELANSKDYQPDLLNVTTLAAEIIFGIFIALVVYVYSKRMHEENQKQQAQIEEMMKKQQEFLNEQKEFQENRKIFSINMIRSHLLQLRSVVEEYDVAKASVESIIPDAKDLVNYYENTIKQDLKNMTFQLTFSADVLEAHHVEAIRHILEITDQYITNKPPHSAKHHGIIGNIDSLLSNLPDYPA